MNLPKGAKYMAFVLKSDSFTDEEAYSVVTLLKSMGKQQQGIDYSPMFISEKGFKAIFEDCLDIDSAKFENVLTDEEVGDLVKTDDFRNKFKSALDKLAEENDKA